MAEDRRWTLITGASSGIGAELARAFAARGRSLVLTARRYEPMAELAAAICRDHRVEIEILAHDLEDTAAPEALIGDIAGRGIVLDTLVNNAGFGLRGDFARLPLDREIGMIEVNVTALTRLCRLVLPDLTARRAGGILNVASTAAFQAGPHMAVYYATKAYVLSLSEALHEEVKDKGVTVTALCPGPTRTEFQDRAGMRESTLFRFAMSAAEVARIGVEGYEAGRAIVVPGLANRFGTIGVKLVPRALARRIAGRLQA